MPDVFLECAAANDALRELAPGSARLANFSPPYLDLVDYNRAAKTGSNHDAWRPSKRVSVLSYVDEMLTTASLVHEVLADDGVITLEVDDVRVPRAGRLILLSDIWRQILESVGFRISEIITLVRQIEIGHRSGVFLQNDCLPGRYYPGNVTSDLVVAFKGNPQARLRRDATPADRIDRAWAQRFLTNAWKIQPPHRSRHGHRGHPCPQDRSVVRASVRFYSLRGDLVVDPFAGEGTTPIVALEEGRSAAACEIEPGNVSTIRARLPQPALPFSRGRATVMIPGSQMYLPLDDLSVARIRHAYLDGSRSDGPTQRERDMALDLTRRIGSEIPPELLSLMLRVERQYYKTPNAA